MKLGQVQFKPQEAKDNAGGLADVPVRMATSEAEAAKAIKAGQTVLILETATTPCGHNLSPKLKAGPKHGWKFRQAFKLDVDGTARKAVAYGEFYIPERQPQTLDDL